MQTDWWFRKLPAHVSICEIHFKEGAGRNQGGLRSCLGNLRGRKENGTNHTVTEDLSNSKAILRLFLPQDTEPRGSLRPVWAPHGAWGTPRTENSLVSHDRAAGSSGFLPTPVPATLLITAQCPLFVQTTHYVKPAASAPLGKLACQAAAAQLAALAIPLLPEVTVSCLPR